MDNRSERIGYGSNLTLNGFGIRGRVQHAAECNMADTTRCLDSPGATTLRGSSSTGMKRKLGDTYGADVQGNAFLSLGLGRPSSSSDNSKGSSATVCTMSSAKELSDEGSSMDLGLNFQLNLGTESTVSRKKPTGPLSKYLKTGSVCDLQLSLSTGPSVITDDTVPVSAQQQNSQEISMTASPVQTTDDEASTPFGGAFGSHLPSAVSSGCTLRITASETITADLPSIMTETVKSPVACTSRTTHIEPRNTSTKTCQFQGCSKVARGAYKLCIAHGGGRRCQKDGCHKGAEGRTIYCKAHGGGRRCQFLGCTKSAEGRTDHCIAHGGGWRCSHDGCIRAARGKSGLCIRHGGGKRCRMENCTKSAEGYSGLCISHGGGRRCQFPECTKGAQGSTSFCKAHGGGKRCTALGCTKGAEGSTPFCKGHGGGKRCSFHGGGVCPKSVHGGTLFCVAHGGGKRCAVVECTRSARGRTDFCVRHGGGKRCKSDGCGKSAQGSTDFCKAHGGGKRCSWQSHPCDRFARGKIGLCSAHSALVQDNCVHGGSTLGPATIKNEKLKDIAVEGDMFSWGVLNSQQSASSKEASQPKSLALDEGRVHGGSLMAYLSGSGAAGDAAGTSKQGPPNAGLHRWV